MTSAEQVKMDWADEIAEKFGDEWSDNCCDHPYEVDFDALAKALRDARSKALDEAAAIVRAEIDNGGSTLDVLERILSLSLKDTQT